MRRQKKVELLRSKASCKESQKVSLVVLQFTGQEWHIDVLYFSSLCFVKYYGWCCTGLIVLEHNCIQQDEGRNWVSFTWKHWLKSKTSAEAESNNRRCQVLGYGMVLQWCQASMWAQSRPTRQRTQLSFLHFFPAASFNHSVVSHVTHVWKNSETYPTYLSVWDLTFGL